MSKQNIETSGLSLSKGTNLKGDDFFEVKVMDNITVAVVCDGVGSALQGQYAAKHTTQFLVHALKNRPRSWSMEKSIKHFVKNVNRVLYLESMAEYGREEIVTTLALVVIEGDRLYGANVGDSRIYLQRKGVLAQLSDDQSMKEEWMSGVLTQAIGIDEDVTIFYFENNLFAEDRVLLCSDGLYTEMSEDELSEGVGVSASFLVKELSNRFNGLLPDDTTAVVIEIKEVDPRLRLKQSVLIVQEDYEKDEIIDGYKLIKPLIANERTWLCQKRGKEYVIKFAPYEAVEDEVILDFFVKEVWMASRLKAGFFPKAVVPKNRTHRYYVMAFIEGENLKKYIENKPLSIDLAIELGIFLLKMSQFLFKYDLVHGDIKPENIMVTDRKGKLAFKMIDFGSITEAYSDTSKAGTPSYLAPERFKEAPISEQSEIYAIGVTLYEVLTRKYPFGEIEPFQNPSFKKSIKQPSKINPKIPLWFDSILLRALDVNIDRRYKNYSNMQYEILNPTKVKPFFKKETLLLWGRPLLSWKMGFFLLLALNIWQYFKS